MNNANQPMYSLLNLLSCDYKTKKGLSLIDDKDFSSFLLENRPESDMPMKRLGYLINLCKKGYECVAGPLVNNVDFHNITGEDWEYLKDLRDDTNLN